MAEREELEFVLYIGTATMVAVALGLIAFIVFYQRKIIAKQRRINEIELKNQKRLVAAEINTKEREQKRIAQELHDDIGSSLTAIRFMTQKIDDSQEVKKELMEALGLQQERYGEFQMIYFLMCWKS
jgi:signal transduction histidine kinase